MIKGGFHGQVLRVDLSSGDIQSQPLDEAIALKFLGGRGYGAKILYDENPPGVDPYSPENRLVFFTSPLMGTKTPCCVKCALVTKSPLTQTILMSFSGGHFGPELKLSGYDGIVVVGKAKHPVYLHINNDDVQIKDARFIWGKDTVETQEMLQDAFGDKAAKVAAIGPAGENLVRFACVANDRRTFGRGGSGAVMGAKNLKAIIVRGTKSVKLFDEPAFNALVTEIRKRFKQSEAVKYFRKYGTSFGINTYNELGLLPTRNFQSGVFEGASQIGMDACLDAETGHKACYLCPVGCSAVRSVTKGPYAGASSEGPEYETLYAFGSQCGNDYLPAIIASDDLCDRYGLDTISTGNTIGFAMECFERGLINKEDTDGLELKFGNHQAMVELVKKMAFREGFGNVLAEGSLRAAQQIGKDSQRLTMQIKGSELAGFDPRGAMAMGLGFATSPRGGDHERAYVYAEVGSIPTLVDRFTTKGKAALLKFVQDEQTVVDALSICCFLAKGEPMGLPDYAKLYTYATGIEMTKEELMVIGERIWNLERLFNNREGFSRKDDTMPERFINEALSEGASAGHKYPLEEMLDEYYRERSWDANGVPTKALLAKLGLQG